MPVQKCRDEASGLFVSDRFFQPENGPKPHPAAWLLVDVLLLECMVNGLLMLFVSGFSVPVSRWFFPAASILCGAVTVCCRSQWCRRHTLVTFTAFMLLYFLGLFLFQEAFFRGAGQFRALVAETMKRTYQAEQAAAPMSTEEAGLFLFLAAAPGVMWLGTALFQRNSMMMVWLLLFPVLALLVLCGGAKNTAALFLVLLGILLCMAYSRPRRQLRMWGGKNRGLQKLNRQRFQSIQKKSTLWMLCAFLALSVPGFFLVRPMLALSLKPAQQISMEYQGNFLSKVMKLLPELSAGAWNLNLEAVGGGVQDGAVGSSEGYLLEGGGGPASDGEHQAQGNPLSEGLHRHHL